MLDETQGLGFVRQETHEEETALSHLLVPQHSEAAIRPHRLYRVERSRQRSGCAVHSPMSRRPASRDYRPAKAGGQLAEAPSACPQFSFHQTQHPNPSVSKVKRQRHPDAEAVIVPFDGDLRLIEPAETFAVQCRDTRVQRLSRCPRICEVEARSVFLPVNGNEPFALGSASHRPRSSATPPPVSPKEATSRDMARGRRLRWSLCTSGVCSSCRTTEASWQADPINPAWGQPSGATSVH